MPRAVAAPRSSGHRSVVRKRAPVDRVVSALLLVGMAIGSLALWIAVPAAVLKALVPLSDSIGYHLGVGLLAVPAAMIAFGIGLAWMNKLYLRVNGEWDGLEEDNPPSRARGPLEPLIVWSLWLALIAMALWFFLLAENPVVSAHLILRR